MTDGATPLAKVAVLGSSGMLGWMVLEQLSGDPALTIAASRRGQAGPPAEDHPGVRWLTLDAERVDREPLERLLEGFDWVINAIGVIKPHIRDDVPADVERALRVNAVFPHTLAGAAEKSGCRVLQIATDCVYSGARGLYRESDPHDALDVYGKTKSLGEVGSPRMHHLRCSIIGPEPKTRLSLLEWLRGQSRGAALKGYSNHRWNGVTTLHFARLCSAIIKKDLELPNLQHVVPRGTISKAELLQCMAREFDRGDLAIADVDAPAAVDRTLATEDEVCNRRLWTAAGYADPPTVPEMIAELVQRERRVGAGVNR
jgi:dTDP-4-dehydrorhamnose reductase